MHACEVGSNKSTINSLLNAGFSLHDRDSNGYTPVMLSICAESMENTKILLTHGAEIDAKDNDGRTALRILIDKRYPDSKTVQVLLEAGADPLVVDTEQNSVLAIAIAQEKDEEVINLLRKASYQTREQ